MKNYSSFANGPNPLPAAYLPPPGIHPTHAPNPLHAIHDIAVAMKSCSKSSSVSYSYSRNGYKTLAKILSQLYTVYLAWLQLHKKATVASIF